MTTKRKKRKRGGASNPCPKCKGDSHVIITRRHDETVFRKRECLSCGHAFDTLEGEVSPSNQVKVAIYFSRLRSYDVAGRRKRREGDRSEEMSAA